MQICVRYARLCSAMQIIRKVVKTGENVCSAVSGFMTAAPKANGILDVGDTFTCTDCV